VNKKKQKNFILGPGAFPTPREAEQKSFLVLFFKKERLVFVESFTLSNGSGARRFFSKNHVLSFPQALLFRRAPSYRHHLHV
jgi:hypothetical protein